MADPSREAVGRALGDLIAASFAEFLARQRWFGSKGRRLGSVSLVDWGPIAGPVGPWWVLVEAGYENGMSEIYAAPVAARSGDDGEGHLIGRLTLGGASMVAYDAFDSPEFCLELLDGFETGRTVRTRAGTIRFTRTGEFPSLLPRGSRSARRLTAEQSNTSVVFDQALILKAFRKVEAGVNPGAEITGFLTTRTRFRNIPLLAGAAEYSGRGGLEAPLAVLEQFVPNQGDGWAFTLDHVRRFLEFAGGRPEAVRPDGKREPQLVREFSAGFFVDLRRLGALTAGLHVALAADPVDPAFAPEPITEAEVGRWGAEIAGDARLTLGLIRGRQAALPEPARAAARGVLAYEEQLIERIRALEVLASEGCVKARIHGDYHLGQTLKTSSDFVIFDFEGEPARPLAKRRAKHCPLRDVAGMLRSFDYAVAAALRERAAGDRAAAGRLDVWGEIWAQIAAQAFLEGYLAEVIRAPARLVPISRAAFDTALAVYQIDKALYELRYEVNNRPAWVPIPLQGLGRLLARGVAAGPVRQNPPGTGWRRSQ